MADLEFDLAQGWSRGLRIVFEDVPGSAAFNPKVALHVEQVHGDFIYEVTDADLKRASPLAKADGLLVRGGAWKTSPRPILIKTADCAPLFYVDREAEAICAVHAGWRGLAQGIHRKPFEAGWMDPKKTWVWLGPCLSGESFEVGADLWEKFPRHLKVPGIFTERPGQPDKKSFHAWKLIEHDLRGLGVELLYNVEVDTFKDAAYHSYRREGAASKGRNYSWARFF